MGTGPHQGCVVNTDISIQTHRHIPVLWVSKPCGPPCCRRECLDPGNSHTAPTPRCGDLAPPASHSLFPLPTLKPQASNLYLSHFLCCCVPGPGADVAQQGLSVSLMKDERAYGDVFLGRRILNPLKGTCVLNRSGTMSQLMPALQWRGTCSLSSRRRSTES